MKLLVASAITLVTTPTALANEAVDMVKKLYALPMLNLITTQL